MSNSFKVNNEFTVAIVFPVFPVFSYPLMHKNYELNVHFLELA